MKTGIGSILLGTECLTSGIVTCVYFDTHANLAPRIVLCCLGVTIGCALIMGTVRMILGADALYTARRAAKRRRQAEHMEHTERLIDDVWDSRKEGV